MKFYLKISSNYYNVYHHLSNDFSLSKNFYTTERKMKNKILLCLSILTIAGCNADSTTGVACLGKNGNSLVESMQNICKKGDAIATKNPVYFCDFNYSIAYNDYNSAMCIYTGSRKKERSD